MNGTSKRLGVWIDHAWADIVSLEGGKTTVHLVVSEATGHRRSTGHQGVALPGHAGGGRDAKDQRHREQELARYYEEVAQIVEDAAGLLILGPGEAPGELKRHLDGRAKKPGSVWVNASDKLTEGQLIAAVKHFFGE
jgi:hypothetical protein